MLQLVNDRVLVLNPPKDNLICDAGKVEEILGVPPERVVDVMALRGDTIDNIPGAPGIGDKGSVELIKRFGTVEQALDRAAEVEKKSYRESLENNRDIVLFSKRMAAIDCHVPVDLNPDAMRAGAPDVEALRALFTELEFTSLLKELLPVVEVTEAHYAEAKSAADVEAVLKKVSAGAPLAVAIEAETAVEADDEEEDSDQPQESMLPLSAPAAEALPAADRRNLRGFRYSPDRFPATRRSCRAIEVRARRREHPEIDSRLQGGDPRLLSARNHGARGACTIPCSIPIYSTRLILLTVFRKSRCAASISN